MKIIRYTDKKTAFATIVYDDFFEIKIPFSRSIQDLMEMAIKNVTVCGFFSCLAIDSDTGEILFVIEREEI